MNPVRGKDNKDKKGMHGVGSGVNSARSDVRESDKDARVSGSVMKVIMISTDRKIFEEDSAVRFRMAEYGTLVDELHIIVFTTAGGHFTQTKLSENVIVYPTSSVHKLLCGARAISIGNSLLKKNKYSKWLVTTQDPFETGLAGLSIARRNNIKLQVQVHTDFLDPYFRRQSFINKIRLYIARFVIPKATCIRVVSERIKRSLVRKYGTSVEPVVLPVYVNISVSAVTHTENKPFPFTILMASRLEPEKNIPLALRAFTHLHKEYGTAGMIILGEGGEKKRLEALAQSLDVGEYVTFLGWKDDLYPFLAMADVFLNTSQFEGYGLVFVEAAAAGCPIISTQVGIVGDVFDDEAVLMCGVNDEACILRQLKHALLDTSDMENRGNRARNIALHEVMQTKEAYLAAYQQTWEYCCNVS